MNDWAWTQQAEGYYVEFGGYEGEDSKRSDQVGKALAKVDPTVSFDVGENVVSEGGAALIEETAERFEEYRKVLVPRNGHTLRAGKFSVYEGTENISKSGDVEIEQTGRNVVVTINKVTGDLTIKAPDGAVALATLTYDSNGATSGTAPGNQTNELSETVEVAEQSNLERVGYEFGGWSTYADGKGTLYNTADELTLESDMTLFARWIPKDNAVRFASGEHGTLNDKETVEFVVKSGSMLGSAESFRLPTVTAETGYRFTGVWMCSNGSTYGSEYVPGVLVTGAESQPITFTAQIVEKDKASVIFEPNGGQGSGAASFVGLPGTSYTAPADPTRNRYAFAGWERVSGGAETVGQFGPENDVTVYRAKWTYISRDSDDPSYSILVEEAEHGSVSSSHRTAASGTAVTLTVKADAGYLLKTLVVSDKDGEEIKLTNKGDGKYSFTMPDGRVTVSAVFAEDYGYERGYASCPKDAACPIEPYADAVNTAWYHDGVHFCIENGLMVGVSDDGFAPSGSVTRAQVVTILWRLEGKPAADYASGFGDVPDGDWYTEAVHWAAGYGIVTGYGASCFGPNDPITREQFAAILWRYSQFKGYDVSVGEDTNILDFDDAQSVSAYAVPAIQWACGSDVMSGVSALTLDPQGVTSRAQAACMIQRYIADAAK